MIENVEMVYMETREKECIEYALHAYDVFWEYYKKTLDERNQILNNYMIFVGVPISVMGIIVEKIKNAISYYFGWIIFALVIILLFGIVIYNAYIVESFISERYLKQIKNITEYLIRHFDINYKKVFSEVYSLDNLFLNRKDSAKHRLRKSALVIIVNTMIIGSIISIISITYLDEIKWYCVFSALTLSFFIHRTIFIYHKRYEI